MNGVIFCGRGEDLIFLIPSDLADAHRWCCLAAAEDGPAACTCWEPIFDARQLKPRTRIAPETRSKACVDCAYRVGSPERERGEALEELPNFWCHQGIRRPAAFRHPDGRVRPVPGYAESPDYRPPMIAGVPYRADGRPADRCAGWAGVQAGRSR
ncbi:MAG: hypothetical protein L0227_06865 [Chloroflexi bacterium]|nr:hypothetical protein [Chloroflexota bacterium]